MPLYRKNLIACGVLLVLAGCGTLPSEEGPGAPSADAAARGLLAQGRFQEAATEYLRLAEEAAPRERGELRLAAADALLRDNDIDRARRLLDETRLAEGDRRLRLRRDLLRARMALAANAPRRVLDSLPRELDGSYPAPLAIELHRLRSQAYARTGNPIEAARERIALEFLLTDDDAIRRNRVAIWSGLARLSSRALEQVRIAPPDTLGGWLELAGIVKRYGGDPDTFGRALARWRKRYPGHPATAGILPSLVEASRLESKPPRHIALLLPLEGAFAGAAEAIRDGFLAAWYADPRAGARPVVTIRDTTGQDIASLYRQVAGEDVDLVVGPLRKAAVSDLARLGDLPVPTLALNDSGAAPGGTNGADAAAPDGLFRFSLSPEAEARQVAERAWFDGRVQAAVITPEGEWGDRVGTAFVEAWNRLGGLVVVHQRYRDTAADMSAPVQSMLNVDQSYERWRRLRQVLRRNIKHEARRRQDVDFIFMAAFPRQARLLRPQFKFHRASRVPVYATSHVFTGIADKGADRDIDGVTFGDMPWVLEPPAEVPGVRERVLAIWSSAKAGFTRFYAFGADAYRIAPRLGRLRAQPLGEYPGGTGRLRVDAANRVQRRLTWARFEGGVPRILSPE